LSLGHLVSTPGEHALRWAFRSRRPLLPWRDRTPVPEERIEATWERLAEEPADPRRDRLVYVHVPFCANHCLFCGFYRHPLRDDRAGEYVELLLRELEATALRPRARSAPIHAVYLGGGTPSALAARDLARLLRSLGEALPLAPDCEITVEGRILHFDDEKVDACLEAGANRFSIGVQSFDTEVRRAQGRRADRDEVLRFLGRLGDRNRAAVVVDLIFGLPRQTPEVWARDLEACLEVEPDGVDLYALHVAPGTPLHAAIGRGKIEAGAPLAELGPLYAMGVERLGNAGWIQISNSHFARTTRERNRYNLLIKEGAETLPFGAGAGGSASGYSFHRSGDLDLWGEGARAGRPAIGAMHRADAFEPVRCAVTSDLERGRIDLRSLRRARGDGDLPEAEIRTQLVEWAETGLLDLRGDHATLTTAGRFWSTNLAGILLDRLARPARRPSPTPEPS